MAKSALAADPAANLTLELAEAPFLRQAVAFQCRRTDSSRIQSKRPTMDHDTFDSNFANLGGGIESRELSGFRDD